MFTVAPIGRINLLILLSTPLLSSIHFIIDGRVAELETENREKSNTKHQGALNGKSLSHGFRFFNMMQTGLSRQ